MAPQIIGFLAPTFCKIFSPTRIIASTATKYPSDNIPAWNELNPRPTCTYVLATTSVPAIPFNRKLEAVAPEYGLFLNTEKSISTISLLFSTLMNTIKPMITTANKPSERALVQPKSASVINKYIQSKHCDDKNT